MRAAAACALALAALAAGDGAEPSLRGAPGVAQQAVAAAPPDAARAAAVSDAWAGNASAAAFDARQALLAGGGWSQGGDKMWGSGTGVESINADNVAYYDEGMDEAHARCGGSSCALIVNPAGHRTVNTFHIHFVHFESYGSSLKRKLESEVCLKEGWQSGGQPCSGRAAFFPGFPGVFRQAMAAGSIADATVIAWPAACGGRGTIVEVGYGCSIEHQIRGDFDPSAR